MTNENLPEDPRDYYIATEITLRELAVLYKGKSGCSKGWLEKRCASEHWDDAKKKISKKTEEKTIEKIADRRARTLADLNDDHIKRVQKLIDICDKSLKAAVKGDDVTINPSDLRRLTACIIDAQAAERLYNNFAPKAPVAEADDNTEDDTVIDELFEDVLAEFENLP